MRRSRPSAPDSRCATISAPRSSAIPATRLAYQYPGIAAGSAGRPQPPHFRGRACVRGADLETAADRRLHAAGCRSEHREAVRVLRRRRPHPRPRRRDYHRRAGHRRSLPVVGGESKAVNAAAWSDLTIRVAAAGNAWALRAGPALGAAAACAPIVDACRGRSAIRQIGDRNTARDQPLVETLLDRHELVVEPSAVLVDRGACPLLRSRALALSTSRRTSSGRIAASG